MKKILMTIVALLSFCASGSAYNYIVVGPQKYFNSDWDRTDATNQMEVLNNQKFYLIREVVTDSDDEVIEFLVSSSQGTAYYYNYTTHGYMTGNNAIAKASVTIATPGTYTLVFTMKSNNNGTQVVDNTLDVIVSAKVSPDPNSLSLCAPGNMSFEIKDNKFHYKVEKENQTNDITGNYTVQAFHGSNNAFLTYGLGGIANTAPLTVSYILPARPGNYEMDFIFDPIMESEPTYVVKQYYDYDFGATDYFTFSSTENLEVSDDVTAYYITGKKTGSTLMNTVTTTYVPAATAIPQINGTGVIIKGAAYGKARFYTTNTSVTLTGNKLQGTGDSTYDVQPQQTYCFTTKNDAIGFYLATDGTYAANKAFLFASDVNGGSGAREFYGIDFGNEETAISTMEAPQQVGTYYNLQGQPVAHPTKGLYILNGRKVMVR